MKDEPIEVVLSVGKNDKKILLVAGVLERWYRIGGHKVSILACVARLATKESNHEEIPHLMIKNKLKKKQ